MTEGAIFVAPGDGERRRNPVGGHLTYKARGRQTNGTLNAFDTVAAPGEGPPLHVHPDADEVIYTLEGRFLVRLDELEREALPGTFIFIPRGIPHTWQNVGDAPARFLAILTPARLEELFDQYAELPADEAGIDAFRRLGSQAGLEVVGPRLAELNSP